jgi:hypothetical protein
VNVVIGVWVVGTAGQLVVSGCAADPVAHPARERLEWLEVPAQAACWPAFVTSTLQQLAASNDRCRWRAPCWRCVIARHTRWWPGRWATG